MIFRSIGMGVSFDDVLKVGHPFGVYVGEEEVLRELDVVQRLFNGMGEVLGADIPADGLGHTLDGLSYCFDLIDAEVAHSA